MTRSGEVGVSFPKDTTSGAICLLSGSPLADVMVVYAKTYLTAGPRGITAFLVEKESEGLDETESR